MKIGKLLKTILLTLLLIPISSDAQVKNSREESILDVDRADIKYNGIYRTIFHLSHWILSGSKVYEEDYGWGKLLKTDLNKSDYRYISILLTENDIEALGMDFDTRDINPKDIKDYLYFTFCEEKSKRNLYGEYKFQAYKNCKDNIVVELDLFDYKTVQITVLWYDKSIRHKANYLMGCDLINQ